MAYKLVLAYDGGAFHGFQRQPGKRTVEGVVEDALHHLTGRVAPIIGASRTDAGVHAQGQVALWSPEACRVPPGRLKAAMNARLPMDVRVRDAALVPDAFDIRRAGAKTYSYRIAPGGSDDLFVTSHSWAVFEPVSLPALDSLSRQFLGTHDFYAFRGEGSSARTTVRRILAVRWHAEGALFVFHVTGTGFLYHMVRLMVGALVADVGGRRPGLVREGLAAAPGFKTGELAPPWGLTLERIDFL
jgi:tRNA pseudouridine38-40 synthase